MNIEQSKNFLKQCTKYQGLLYKIRDEINILLDGYDVNYHLKYNSTDFVNIRNDIYSGISSKLYDMIYQDINKVITFRIDMLNKNKKTIITTSDIVSYANIYATVIGLILVLNIIYEYVEYRCARTIKNNTIQTLVSF